MLRIICFTAIVALGATVASAEPYWIAYEGNDFPENQGWWHIWGGPPAQRWIEEGCLVIDSRESILTADFYQMHLNGNLDPGPNELFIMEWRVRIEEVLGPYDLGMSVRSDERWAVGFHLSEDTLYSTFESGVSAPFEPGVFHEFELRSADMRNYGLYIDGLLAIEGSFWLSTAGSRVGWGDTVQGAASLSRWDYVRFGVVPEPGTLLLAIGTLVSIAARRQAR